MNGKVLRKVRYLVLFPFNQVPVVEVRVLTMRILKSKAAVQLIPTKQNSQIALRAAEGLQNAGPI